MIRLKIPVGEKEYKTVTMEEICAALHIDQNTNRGSTIELEADGSVLTMAIADEAEYPGVNLDAIDASGNMLFLANAELPNADYPESIVARLYAGYADFETDEPIVRVEHSVMGDAAVKEMAALRPDMRFMKRITVDSSHAIICTNESNPPAEHVAITARKENQHAQQPSL